MIVRLLLSTVLTLPWLLLSAPAQAASPPVDGPGSIRAGESITLSGTGWTTADGTAGSVLAFKLDEGAISTKGEVRHPVTDAVIGNKTVWAVVRADAAGDWSVDLPFPTTQNGTGTWEPGRHGVRILTGSMLEGDTPRTVLVDVDVEVEPAEPEAPSWAHETIRAGEATAWVESRVEAGGGRALRIAGRDWRTRDGRGSTIAVKLNRSATAQYTRSGDDIVDHPSAAGDDTIWALITADADGTFSATLDAPDGLTAGQYLSATVLSGRFDPADVQRTGTSGLLVVGGVPHEGPGGPGEEVTCVPSSPVTSARAEVVADGLGGTLHLTGAGWCHPEAGRGGSTVGVKIDEGAYSRTDTTVHQNRTIWAVVEADPATGELDAKIRLPDGTTAGTGGSVPAFGEGAHTLRLLSGSLKPGDTVRTVQTDTFVVGTYRPTTLPEPVEYTEDLTAGARRGLTAVRSGGRLVVTVAGARAGTYVALSTYRADGSPEYPWGGTWFRTDTSGRISVRAAVLPAERVKLVAQSGDQEAFGDLLGWTWWGTTAAAAPLTPQPEQPSTFTRERSAPRPAPTTPAAPVPAAVVPGPPTAAPVAPGAGASDLTGLDRSGVEATLDHGVATVTVPNGAPGDWVHPFVYLDDSAPVAVGWLQLDAARAVRLDVSAFGDGDLTIALVRPDGSLAGWDRIVVGTTSSAPPSTADSPVLPVVGAGVGPQDDSLLTDADWWLLAAGAALALGIAGGSLTPRKTTP
ncbi:MULTISPECIES: hypothetical protein [unclassified Aeromicrobium]|uniref:hypothetical protein n=1 Tax=unclassified Aeromicrobium TaxID=2633570 RepID=UPI00396B4016